MSGNQTLELRARWDDLTSFVSKDVTEKWWKIIIERYAARAFYNLDHLTQMFTFYDEYKDKLKDRYGTAFAVFFKQ
uniref:Uncharacterized protein n=1 Tax=Panagrolaimus sp. PS1159 TaxID=55785 RepID=A0AC35EYV1_9BILA